jgi:hypothetical protein
VSQPDDVVNIKDFTPKGREKRRVFKHGGDVFELVSAIPLDAFPDFILMGETLSKLDVREMHGAIDQLKDAFRLALTDESAERFITRLNDKLNPIGYEALSIFAWAVSELTARPTEESSDSSVGSSEETSGSDSTAGAPVPAAIL